MLNKPIVLQTPRLHVRPFEYADLDAINAVLNESFGHMTTDDRGHWLAWTRMGYIEQARLYQPPFGDRAVVLRATGQVIGAVGFVPSFGPFDLLPGFAAESTGLNTTEMGLFYVLGSAWRGQGFATEAARALASYAFTQLGLKRLVATTEHDNAASIAVMQRLGMTLHSAPPQAPPWFQVIGVLHHNH